MESNIEPAISIRHALRPGDLGRVTELHGVLYAEEWGFDPSFEAYVAGTLAEFVEGYRSARDRLWIAECNGLLAGTVGVIGRGDRESQLRWLLVHPQSRGQGLGRRLVNEVIDFSRAAGCRSVYLWTVDVLTGAARLYREAGFRKTEVIPPASLWGRTLSEERYDLALEDAGSGDR